MEPRDVRVSVSSSDAAPPHMRPYEQTPPSSPVKKKLRLLSSDGVVQSDALGNAFVVQPKLGFSKATTLLPSGTPTSSDIIDDPENPFTNQLSESTEASSVLPGFGFALASSSQITTHQPEKCSLSSDSYTAQEFDEWFKPMNFQTATLVPTSTSTASFMCLRSKATLAPSTAALAQAQARLREIWDDDSADSENVDPLAKTKDQPKAQTQTDAKLIYHRPALQNLDNGPQTPSTPTPTGFSRPSVPGKPQAIDQLRAKQKPFRSPLLKNAPRSTFVSSPSNSGADLASAANVSSHHPTMPSTPLRSNLLASKLSSFQTPVRVPANTQRKTPGPFVTPFKPGMRPGEPGWTKLQDSIQKGSTRSVACTSAASLCDPSRRPGTKLFKSFFDLRPPANRKTLVASGFRPQQFYQEDFEYMDINIQELQQITPTLAAYYSFHTASTLPPSQTDRPAQVLGPTAALKELHDLGCILTTKAWIDNHWSLVLWKLAGMVALDPDSESESRTKRWCWTEVKRQLLYRYERELNQARRPALRLIAAQDASASRPLALCVSNVSWVEAEDHQGTMCPELEVTDGWYRLRAKIDAPMTRAVKKGVIRIGRKIGVAGARLDSERKEPQEILDAYNSVKLILSGNSSHLLPWDAKLGFVRGPCISTMHSLTPDGGSIAAMDVVVVKTHAIGFIEFVTDPDGRKRREGPRGEVEETRINEEWKKKRDWEASKLRTQFEKKVSRYESYIGRLERRAGSHFHPRKDDEPPNHIEGLYDQLEEHEEAMRMLSQISAQDAGWLARHIRQCLKAECEHAGEEIARELEATCPPRDIRSFRVIIVEDSRTYRRPAHRHAQLTVWDALTLTLSEGAKPGAIDVGNHFRITNLIPQQQGAWMGNQPNSQIFLATTRASQWRKLKVPY